MNLETIVNNMISANEPESNIAMVIKTFKQVRDSKKKKSPLKQIESTECPQGYSYSEDEQKCIPTPKNPVVSEVSTDGTVIKEDKDAPDSSVEFEEWIRTQPTVPNQWELDRKRQELGLPLDNSKEAILRRNKEPDVQQLDEVVVVEGEEYEGRDPVQVQTEQEKRLTRKQQAGLDSLEQQVSDALGPLKPSGKELMKMLTNSTNQGLFFKTLSNLYNQAGIDTEALQREKDLLNKVPNVINETLESNEFLKNFPKLVLENNKEKVTQAQNDIYGGLLNYQQEVYNDINNSPEIQKLKNKFLKESGIPFIMQDGELVLPSNIDTNSPQFQQREKEYLNKLNDEIDKRAQAVFQNDEKYVEAVKKADEEYNAFTADLISKAEDENPVVQEILNGINNTVKDRIQSEVDARLKRYKGSGSFGDGFYELTLANLPKRFEDFQTLMSGRNIQRLQKDIKRIEEGRINTLKDGRVQYVNPGGGSEIYQSIEEAVKSKRDKIDEYAEDAGESIIKSQEYQQDIVNFENPEVFDEDGLTVEDFGKILGTQSVQMLGAILTLGGSTLVQEAGGALDEILAQKAASNLGISIEQFNALENDAKIEALKTALAEGEADLDTALMIGVANAGLDLVGNFIGLGAATKAIPKGFLKAVLRGRYDKAANKYLSPQLQNLVYASGIESGTEVGQEIINVGGVASATGQDVMSKLISPEAQKQYLEAGTQAFISTGPMIGGGKVTASTLNLLRTSPEGLQLAINNAENQYKTLSTKISNSNLSPTLKRIELDKLDNNLESTYDRIEAANAFIQSTKLKDLKGEQAEIAYESIAAAVPIQKQLNEVNAEIKTIEDAGGVVSNELLATKLNLEKTQSDLNNEVKLQRALSLTEQQGDALIEVINKSNEGNLKGKTVTKFDTKEQAKNAIVKKYGEEALKKDNVIKLLEGDKKGIFNNAIKIENDAYIVNENVRDNIKVLGDAGAANAVNHEVAHILMDGISYTDLNNLKKSVIGELKNSTDPKMKKAYEQVNERLKGYAGLGKQKGGRTALAQEFFTALSDSMMDIEINDIALEDVNILQKIGNLFTNAINTTEPGVIDFGNMDGTNALEFIKRFNNFDKGTVITPISAPTKIKKTERPTLASQPLTSEEINTQVKDIKKGEMTDEFAVQVAYAYEPLAQTIAKGIYRNYPEFKEQGYTQNDFVDDITFGDPKEIGGTNSLMEIAKQYDPNNPEGKSLGGWLKDIGTQRAKRIADVRIGKQRTTAAQTTETKESQQVADKPAPEITLDKPTTKALALPKELEEKVTDNITELAVLNIGAQLKKSPKATPKQKTTIKEKAASSIVNREVGKDVKRVIKNLGVDAANDYISKNYRAVAEAFVKDKNINKIRDAKTKELLQGWKDGNITKESVTGYFNDPNVKSNTRSDRRNRALNDVIVYNLTRDAVNKYVAKNPEASQKSIEDTGIDLVLASKALLTNLNTINKGNKIQKLKATPNNFNKLKTVYNDRYKKEFGKDIPTGAFAEFYVREHFIKKGFKPYGETKDRLKGFSKTPGADLQFTDPNGNIVNIEVKERMGDQKGKSKPFLGSVGININLDGKITPKESTDKETFNLLKPAIKENMPAFKKYMKAAGINSMTISGMPSNIRKKLGPERSGGNGLQSDLNINSKIPFKKVMELYNEGKNSFIVFAENDQMFSVNPETLNSAPMMEGITEFDAQGRLKFAGTKNNTNGATYSIGYKFDNFPTNKGVSLNEINIAPADLSAEFNQMIERTKGVKAEAIYSDTRAKKLGEKRGFQAFVPYSAEDFLGLIYPTLEKGKQGDKDLQWWKDNVMNPYNDGMTAFETAKQAAMLEWKQIQDKVQNTPTNLNKEAVRGFTNQDAVRVYLWNEQDVLPDNKDLASKDVKALVDHVNNNAKLKKFADELQKLSPQGYPAPTPGWNAGTITTDLVNFVNTETRNQYLQPYFEAVDAIFTPDNLNKLRAQYGNRYVEALEDTLYRMKTGRNRPSGANRQTNLWLNWVNDSVGTIMFFNMRSALLQTISSVNFVNWSDNNPARAAAAFANQKQYWKDFSTLFNSDFLKQRRSGLKTDVNADEIAASAAASTNKVRAGISYLLKKGFLPTQLADSFAIASGGSTFYRNRIKALQKEGLSKAEAEKQAFADFRTLANESQQSSDPSRISMEQASPLGRVILAFANTPIQYTRLTKRAIQDLRNGRGDWKTNVSKIVYYGIAQNIIFTALQQAMFGMLFTDDDDLEDLGPKEKKFREDQKSKSRFNILNSTADMFLRGSGVMGAFVAMFKNLGLEIKRQLDKPSRRDFEKVADKIWTFSPALDSKFKKLQSAGRTFTYKQELEKIRTRGFALNNPALDAALKIVSAFANIPADRVLRKLNHIVESTDSRNAIWQRIALAMGWGEWELGISARKQDEEKAISDSFKALDKSISRAVKKRKKEEEKEKKKKKKSPIKVLQHGVLGRANRDGSIEVAAGLSPAKKKEVVAHEKRHQQEMKSGKLDYDDNFVYYGKKKFERKNGQIAHGGKWKPEGDHSLPWEKFAHNYKRK